MHRDNVLNVLQQTEEKRIRFLAAWKHGVEYLGPKLFGPGSPETAKARMISGPYGTSLKQNLPKKVKAKKNSWLPW
jgi:hypothetical protein